MKKKKGSSILMVLVISAVIIMLLGTAVSAMTFTQRANLIKKIDNDFLYAAEGGVELRTSLIRKDVRYGKTILDSADQLEVDNMEIKLKTNKVHSVETKTEELVVGKRIKITSTAYGYADDRSSIDLNKKKTVEKIIVKTGAPSSAKIFESSIVAEDNITIDAVLPSPGGSGAGVTMDTTRVIGGDDINLPVPRPLPPIVTRPTPANIINDKIQSAIFRPIDAPIGLEVLNKPNIREKGNITVTSIDQLIDDAETLNSDGHTISENGIGKFEHASGAGHPYTIILVNANKLTINLNTTVFRTNTIIICSGDLELQMLNNYSSITLVWSTLFGNNVVVRIPSSLNIVDSPATNPITGPNANHIDSINLAKIDLIISKYILNWGGATVPPGSDIPGGSGVWREDESKTIYQ